ncbi:hypothetical protein Nepgr_031772 [Nepenthes gracilis]|uniref:Uncharacterized protein n=1 Tax=Nepenthes gracilis TaxID=150966 RepID=A0AAD3TIX3_NEPGR|nr:hypothetical protein Nepgr_031772 [Nepenthes gracilis]
MPSPTIASQQALITIRDRCLDLSTSTTYLQTTSGMPSIAYTFRLLQQIQLFGHINKRHATVQQTAATRLRSGQPGTDNDRSQGLAPKFQHQQSIFHTSAQQSCFSIFRALYGYTRTMKHVDDDHPLQHHGSATTAGSKAGEAFESQPHSSD